MRGGTPEHTTYKKTTLRDIDIIPDSWEGNGIALTNGRERPQLKGVETR